MSQVAHNYFSEVLLFPPVALYMAFRCPLTSTLIRRCSGRFSRLPQPSNVSIEDGRLGGQRPVCAADGPSGKENNSVSFQSRMCGLCNDKGARCYLEERGVVSREQAARGICEVCNLQTVRTRINEMINCNNKWIECVH
jgi:hypothetical protein